MFTYSQTRRLSITPTLDTSEYAEGDVLFVGTELKLPAKTCVVESIYATWKDSEATAGAIFLYFFESNDTAIGTINDAPNITAANLVANGFLGGKKIHFDSRIEGAFSAAGIGIQMGFSGGQTDSGNDTVGPVDPVLLKSTREDRKIFVQGAWVDGGNTSQAITSASDALQIHFNLGFNRNI
tara:strand:+ start:2480 stop:3025 length:546 start_codon:yes stop_codon:yes gene_type:complete